MFGRPAVQIFAGKRFAFRADDPVDGVVSSAYAGDLEAASVVEPDGEETEIGLVVVLAHEGRHEDAIAVGMDADDAPEARLVGIKSVRALQQLYDVPFLQVEGERR